MRYGRVVHDKSRVNGQLFSGCRTIYRPVEGIPLSLRYDSLIEFGVVFLNKALAKVSLEDVVRAEVYSVKLIVFVNRNGPSEALNVLFGHLRSKIGAGTFHPSRDPLRRIRSVERGNSVEAGLVAHAVSGDANLSFINARQTHCILNCCQHSKAVRGQSANCAVSVAMPGSIHGDDDKAAAGKLNVARHLHFLCVSTAVAAYNCRNRIVSGGILRNDSHKAERACCIFGKCHLYILAGCCIIVSNHAGYIRQCPGEYGYVIFAPIRLHTTCAYHAHKAQHKYDHEPKPRALDPLFHIVPPPKISLPIPHPPRQGRF